MFNLSYGDLQRSNNNNTDINDDQFMEDIELQQLSNFRDSSRNSSSSSLSSILETISQLSDVQRQQKLQQKLRYNDEPINSDQDFLVEDDYEETYREGSTGVQSLSQRLDDMKQMTTTKRRCFLVTVVIFALWLTALISYSQGTKSYYTSHGSNSVNEHKSEHNDTQIHESQPPPPPKTPSMSDSKDGTKRKISLLDYRMGNFYVFNVNLKFIGKDNYIVRNAKNYQYKNFVNNEGPVMFDSLKFEYGDLTFSVEDFRMSPLKDKVILITDSQEQWRHSSWSKYWIYDTNSQNIIPLYKDDLKLQHLLWSPQGRYITFIYKHDIYIRDVTTDEVIQLTYDGSLDVFNGKPDWVYEEEVLSTDNSIWWAPDDSNIMFMRLNDTKVPSYPLEFFLQEADQKYPTIEDIKYPKPGFANPIPTLVNYELSSGKLQELPKSEFGDEFVLYYLQYINPQEILIKETDRESNLMNVNIFNTKTGTSKTVRKVNSLDYGGWIEKPNNIVHVHKGVNHGYIDTVVYEGYNHLLYFQNFTDSEPYKMLTHGEFDITEQYSYNKDTNEVYLISTIPEDPLSHHFFKITLDGDYHLHNLTDTSKKAYYGITFNEDASHAVLNYQGPQIPYQKMITLQGFNSTYYKNLPLLNNNLMATLAHSKFEVPTTTYGNLTFDGLNFQYIEIKPLNFDPSKSYPLLVNIYGGPGSIKLSNAYGVGFEHVVSSSLDLVVLYLDPRGTGGKGWDFKKFARENIGYWEPRDITNIVKTLMLHKTYINRDKTAIWGWSYGGFTTLKTLEYDGGSVFKYGMAVAPVTDWTFYDSIYTERYMNKPENNIKGYEESRINDVRKFKKVKKFLIMHGTADDNVHLQNTLKLLDKFDLNNVENYEVHFFPDSNHSIYFDNANAIVYDKLFNWLKNAFGR